MIRTVSALLYRRNKLNQLEILLHKHKFLTENGKPVWLGVGGKVEPNEHETEALVREVFEESGISLMYSVYNGIQYDRQRFGMARPDYVTKINLPNGDVMYDSVYEIEITYSDEYLNPESDEMELGWYCAFEAMHNFNMYSDTSYQICKLIDKCSRQIMSDYYERGCKWN